MPLVFAPRMRRDGAAPLIGSSAVMRGAARAHRARRGDRFHRAHRRRKRHRQGAGRAADSRAEPRAGAGRSWPSTARRSSRRCSRPSSSASRTAPRPACAGAAASSSTPTAARCFSTKSSDLSLSAQAKLLRAIQDSRSSASAAHGAPSGQHAHRRGDQPKPLRARRARPVPRRSVLPAERRRNPRAAAAGAARRHSRAGAVFPRAPRPRAPR